jgi:hypothetical protein
MSENEFPHDEWADEVDPGLPLLFPLKKQGDGHQTARGPSVKKDGIGAVNIMEPPWYVVVLVEHSEWLVADCPLVCSSQFRFTNMSLFTIGVISL